MSFGAIAGAVIGGGMAMAAASKSAKASKYAADTSSQAQLEAAQIAAEESRFRPVDLSTAYGDVNWTWGNDGRVSGVTVNPSAWQQGLFSTSNNIYNNYADMLQQYLGGGLDAGASKIYGEMQDLINPTRMAQQSSLFDALAAKGITGIESYDPMTGSNINPYINSLSASFAAADKQMAFDSYNEYLNRLSQLYGGYSNAGQNAVGIAGLPYDTALTKSMEIGGRMSNPTGAQALLQGGMGAAQTQAAGAMAAQQYKNDFWNSAGGLTKNLLSNLNASNVGPYLPGLGNGYYSPFYSSGPSSSFDYANYNSMGGFYDD